MKAQSFQRVAIAVPSIRPIAAVVATILAFAGCQVSAPRGPLPLLPSEKAAANEAEAGEKDSTGKTKSAAAAKSGTSTGDNPSDWVRHFRNSSGGERGTGTSDRAREIERDLGFD